MTAACAELKELPCARFDLGAAGKHFKLLIGRFDDIGKRQQTFHGVDADFGIWPQRCAPVRVVGGDSTVLAGVGNNLRHSRAARLCGEQKRAEAQHLGVCERILIDLIERDLRIGAGVTVKAEIAITGFGQLHERE